MISEPRNLIEKIRLTHESPGSERERLAITLTDPEHGEWLLACKQAVLEGNEQWLTTYAYTEDDALL